MLSLLSLEKEWPKSLKVAHSRQKLSSFQMEHRETIQRSTGQWGRELPPHSSFVVHDQPPFLTYKRQGSRPGCLTFSGTRSSGLCHLIRHQGHSWSFRVK